MPCLRGIEVSLTTKPGDERIPEYPHPEGTSARILGPLENSPNGRAVHRKAGPTVAVYIPSVPGTRFAINYSINNAPSTPCKYVFFRLYMNARPIAAWGIDPNVCPKGKVVKSLWTPCALYSDQIGFEGRNFVFLPGQDYKSVAEDGGLIEIQVFRAKERRARAPRLEEFRFQENYGIAAPSIGLLDHPQDACFYDWHLLDAKDSPFASFRLHYRSWKNLRELNLIPASELELLCAASPKALETIARAEERSQLEGDPSEERSSLSEDSDEAVFHDCEEDNDVEELRAEGGAGPYFLSRPPELFPAVSSSVRVPQPSKATRDAHREPYLQRPLPELPVKEPRTLSRRSSLASITSATLSITPSLQQYVDEGSLNPEEIEIGVAQLVQLPTSESTVDMAPEKEPKIDAPSVSDYETSPRSTGDSASDGKPSPGRYLPMTGSGLERGIAFFASPKPSMFSRGLKSRLSLPSNFYSPRNRSPLRRTNLSDPNWASGSPSSGRAGAADKAARRESSPQAEGVSGRSLFAGHRRKKLSGSPGKLASMVLGRDVRRPEGGGSLAQRVMRG